MHYTRNLQYAQNPIKHIATRKTMQWQLNIYDKIVKFVMKSRDFDEFIIDVLA